VHPRVLQWSNHQHSGLNDVMVEYSGMLELSSPSKSKSSSNDPPPKEPPDDCTTLTEEGTFSNADVSDNDFELDDTNLTDSQLTARQLDRQASIMDKKRTSESFTESSDKSDSFDDYWAGDESFWLNYDGP